jgi:hypothetical protein
MSKIRNQQSNQTSKESLIPFSQRQTTVVSGVELPSLKLPKIEQTPKPLEKNELIDMFGTPKSFSTVFQETDSPNATKKTKFKVFVNPKPEAAPAKPVFNNPYANSSSFNPGLKRKKSSKLSNNSSNTSNNFSALKYSQLNFASAVNGHIPNGYLQHVIRKSSLSKMTANAKPICPTQH